MGQLRCLKLKFQMEMLSELKNGKLGCIKMNWSKSGYKDLAKTPTEPPLHYVGPFESDLQNKGNAPWNVLEEIICHKDTEVSQVDNAPPVRDFIGALKEANLRTGFPGLIAGVKKASPSRWVLREDFDPVSL